MNPIGFRILSRGGPAVAADVLAGYATVGSAQISDSMNRLYGVCSLTYAKPWMDKAIAEKTGASI